MADTLDKVANILALMKGVSSGVTPYEGGGGNVSISGVAGGLGQVMQGNKNLALEREAAKQQLEIQRWQFEQEKENAKARKELRDMEVSQARTAHEASRASAQENFRNINKAQMREVLRGERKPEEVQFLGDRFRPVKDEKGNFTTKMDENFAMLEKVRQGGLESVVNEVPFQKEDKYNKSLSVKKDYLLNPAGLPGFIFKALNPVTNKVENKIARVIPDVDGSVMTDGLSLNSLQELRDLSLAKPEYFDQRSIDKIKTALIERTNQDVALSNVSKQLNAEAYQLGIATDEDLISDAKFNNTISAYVPADLKIAKMKIQQSIIETVKNPTPQGFRSIFQNINELMAGSTKNVFRQTDEWQTIQKIDIENRQESIPLMGSGVDKVGNEVSYKPMKNQNVKDRLKYRVNKNAK